MNRALRLSTFSVVAALLILASAEQVFAEVARVTIDSREPVSGGRPFGTAGPYERLSGTIEFALDPNAARNRGIVNLSSAKRADDGRVHFTSTLYVIQPVDPQKGNGVLLFEISNRGRKGLLSTFDGGRASNDPIDGDGVGDGFLLRDGYTLVWVGWEFDVADGVRLDAPVARIDAATPLVVDFVPVTPGPTYTLGDAPKYPPRDLDDPAATLTVRNQFWDAPHPIEHARWRFSPGQNGTSIALDGGFEPGRVYSVSYRPASAFVAGAGLAAIRDAASAFRYRADLPVKGRTAYVFGFSQSGRFLRQFLYEGFNADEQERRVFDAVWAHVAGAAMGSFNDTYATPTSFQSYRATRRPTTDEPADGWRDGIQSAYRANQRPKVFYTNSPNEYWGGGRAAAMTHASIDGRRDLSLPDNVRIYFYAGVQHSGGPGLPIRPLRPYLQQLENPTPQQSISRALLRALHAWASSDVAPPPSQYPRIADGTLVPASRVRFPMIPGVADPRRAPPPGLVSPSGNVPLPFLVPQVDADGNEISGIRVPAQSVPLGTMTGWNFRSMAAGNTTELYPDAGSFIPFAATRAQRESAGDPRRAIEERYPSRASYLQRIRTAADELVRKRFMLQEDVDDAVAFAGRQWDLTVK